MGAVKGKAKSRSSRAGLLFPVGRIHRLLRFVDHSYSLVYVALSRKGNYAKKVGAGAPVYMAALMEYVAAEILGPCRQCWQGQPEVLYHPKALAACHQVVPVGWISCLNCFIQEWWRAQQTSGWSNHCPGRCSTQPPGCLVAQKECCMHQGESLTVIVSIYYLVH